MMQQEIKAIVTDIEGTTTALSYVTDVLFPYARQHLADYVFEHEDALVDILDAVRAEERNANLNIEEILEVLLRYMDDDRKVTPLKDIQGRIWAKGFEDAALTSHVYDDAAECLKQWKGQGIDLYVYSSGSVEAQKLIFAHASQGDLATVFSGFYDTAVGGKKDIVSYEHIAADIGVPSASLLFLSDNIEEINAAAAAGFNVLVLDREKSLFDAMGHRIVHDFYDILSENAVV